MDQTQIPPMLSGGALIAALENHPPYDPKIKSAPAPERLMSLGALYDVYYPFPSSGEVYTKLYLSLIRSLNKKTSLQATAQYSQNHLAGRGQQYRGLVGGADSFTVIGRSGIGKSTTISRCITLLGGDTVIQEEEPYRKLLPVLVVQCPWDSSIKGLFLSILRSIDDALDTRYYQDAVRSHATTDLLIGLVSNACLSHTGLLIVDEIQNVVNSKNGKNLVGSLTQLINNSGVSIGMIGTPECLPFFEQDYKLSRRSLGLQLDALALNEDFFGFCRTLFRYVYVSGAMELTDSIVHWLYEHSGGITSNVVSLVHDAQEIAILDGSENVTIETLNTAYKKRLGLLHGHIELIKATAPIHKNSPTPIEMTEQAKNFEKGLIAKLAAEAKRKEISFLNLLKRDITVEVITP